MTQTTTGVGAKVTTNTLSATEFNSVNDAINDNSSDAETRIAAAEAKLDQGVQTTDTPAFAGLTVDTDTFYIDAGNDRIGVGTLTPDSTVEINNLAGGGNPTLHLSTAPPLTTTTDLALTGNAVIASEGSLNWVVDTSGYYRWYIGGASNKDGTSGATEAMRLDTSGNLGIGTTTPGAPLAVVGLDTYADDSAAGVGGLGAGDIYKTATGEVRVKL